jgi:hypothetical protein
VPLKESCIVFIIWEHIIMVFSFDALFGDMGIKEEVKPNFRTPPR